MGYTWQYYDIVLFGVATSVLGGVAVGWLTSVSLVVSTAAFSFLALALMGHGMFVNGPIDEPEDLTDEVDALN